MSAVVAPTLPDLDGWPATAILAWALAEFSPRLTVACSMQDAVVVDLAVRLDPTVEVSSSTPASISSRRTSPPPGCSAART